MLICFVDIVSCSENDKAHIRLAAAKSVLRLAGRWDLHISPHIFRSTILVAKVCRLNFASGSRQIGVLKCSMQLLSAVFLPLYLMSSTN